MDYLIMCILPIAVAMRNVTMATIMIIIRQGEVVPVFNSLRNTLWRRKREWRYSSTILDLGTRWKWVVSFTPRPLYPLGKDPGWAPEPVWTLWNKKKSLAPAVNLTLGVQLPRLRNAADFDWRIAHVQSENEGSMPAITCATGRIIQQYSDYIPVDRIA
jgi:hypothetical protein